MIHVQIHQGPFDPGVLINAMTQGELGIGALVSFVGFVRDFNQGDTVTNLFLEHIPGMTEKSLQQIAREAQGRWPLTRIQIHHRVGSLELGEPIVLVATASAHREAAFLGCDFIMDYLKTRAPFWKKEQTKDGSRWVEGNPKDRQAAARWSEPSR